MVAGPERIGRHVVVGQDAHRDGLTVVTPDDRHGHRQHAAAVESALGASTTKEQVNRPSTSIRTFTGGRPWPTIRPSSTTTSVASPAGAATSTTASPVVHRTRWSPITSSGWKPRAKVTEVPGAATIGRSTCLARAFQPSPSPGGGVGKCTTYNPWRARLVATLV